jgi:anthranilate phosphoribosyltransferase
MIADVERGFVTRYTVVPEDFEVEEAPLEAIRGGSPADNAATIRGIFEGQSGAPRDVVVMNAAAALVAAGVAENFAEGARLARAAIDSGAAREKLADLVRFTQIAAGESGTEDPSLRS